LLTLVWVCAVVGIACKWLVPAPVYGVTVGLYVAMGWIGILPVVQLVRAIGYRGMLWAVAGGVLYTAGGVCDAVKWPVVYPGVFGAHEMLHVLDMGGTLAHVVFIIRYVLPIRRPLAAGVEVPVPVSPQLPTPAVVAVPAE
jgi:hemolysin III